LTAEERLAVEAFAKTDPQLEMELDLLNQARLIPDTSIQFEPKELLYRHNSHLSAEWEEMLLSYIDGELSPADKKIFETQLASDPVLQKELAIYQQTKFIPDSSIVFEDKSALYREEREPARIVFFQWKRIAVAAAVLLLVSSSALVLLNRKTGSETNTGSLASGPQNPVNTPGSNTASVNVLENTGKEIQNSQTPDPVLAKATISSTSSPSKQIDSDPKNVPQTKQSVPVIRDQQNNDPLYAQSDVITNNSNINRTILPANPVESAVNQLDPSLSINKVPVTNETFTAYNITDDGNHKSRGLLRKVTRLFERNTNIQATTDDDKLLIGSFAVNLK